MSLLIGILTFVLIITSLFLVMVVLMQRAKTDGGMGSAMGGGSMESTFGAETGNVLSGATIKAAIIFFVVSFVLYLAHIYQAKHHGAADNKLPQVISAPAATPSAPAPAAVQPTTPAPVEPKKP
jgi:preprotein translocase subunit SecG